MGLRERIVPGLSAAHIRAARPSSLPEEALCDLHHTQASNPEPVPGVLKIYLYDGWSEVAVSTSDYHCAPGQVLPSVDAEGEYCSWVDGTVLQGFDDSVALTSSSSTVRASGTLYRFDDDGSRIDPTVIDVAVERTSKPRTTRTMSTWQGGSERVITTTGTAQLSGTIGSESVDRAGTLWEQTQIVRWR